MNSLSPPFITCPNQVKEAVDKNQKKCEGLINVKNKEFEDLKQKYNSQNEEFSSCKDDYKNLLRNQNRNNPQSNRPLFGIPRQNDSVLATNTNYLDTHGGKRYRKAKSKKQKRTKRRRTKSKSKK